MTPANRPGLLASVLLVLGLCWAVAANQEEAPLPPGFVTRYVTPMANLSLEKLVGRWYGAEHVFPDVPLNTTAIVCVIIDFYYSDNGTLLVEPISLVVQGERIALEHTFTVNDYGVWDNIRDGVSIGSSAIVDLSEDNRYLALASCRNSNTKTCGAFVLVRHLDDGERQDKLTELHRILVRAGVDAANDAFTRDIEPCRPIATPSPELNAENGPSTPDTK